MLLIWSLLPVYNMLLIALDPEGDTSSPAISGRRNRRSKASGWSVIQGYWYLEDFWHQFGNSIYHRSGDMVLTCSIGSLASFAVGRMRLSKARLLTQRRAPHLRGPGVLPGRSRSSAHAQLRANGQPVGGHRGPRDVRHPVCLLILQRYAS